MAQAVHAAFHFYRDHPSVVKPWLVKSNFLVVVSVPNEDALLDLITEASRRGIVRTAVREPDLDNEATACALAPGIAARKLCANLPLAMRKAVGFIVDDPAAVKPRRYTDEDAEAWVDVV